jgi:hypothetical protein
MQSRAFHRPALAYIVLIVVVGPSCMPNSDPHWKFQRQVVDSQGQPLSNVAVQVSASRNSHYSGRFQGQITYTTNTAPDGSFAVDIRREFLDITITKPGFVSKEFQLHPRLIDPSVFPATGKIVLSPSPALPAADDLDKQESETLSVPLAPGSQTAVSFLPAGVPGNQPIVFAQPGTNCLLIKLAPGVSGQVLAREPGVEEDSWRASNAVLSLTNTSTVLTLPYKFQLTSFDAAGSFVLKAPQYWVRVTVWPADDTNCSFGFDLSRDNAFVRP